MTTYATSVGKRRFQLGRAMRDVDQKKRMEKIAQMVTETLHKDYESVKILSVKVNPDVDYDGDAVLKIEVVFEGRPRDIDARMISGAVRRVRPHLEKLGELAFPLMSFVSRRDAGMSLGSI